MKKQKHKILKIKNIKQKFEDLTEYEVSLEYDEKGFINKIIIENI